MEMTLRSLSDFLDTRSPVHLALITCGILGFMGLFAWSQHDALEHGCALGFDLNQKRFRYFPIN